MEAGEGMQHAGTGHGKEGWSGEGLPSGWVQSIDPKYQRPFYYNKRTRRSTWTKPVEQDGMGSNASTSLNLSMGQGLGVHGAGKASVTPMPQESPTSQTKRFVAENSAGIFSRAGSRLEFIPSEQSHGSTMSQTSESTNSSAQNTHKKKKKSRWVEVYSPEHKRTYFFNRETKESRWTRPQEMEVRRARKLSSEMGQALYNHAVGSGLERFDTQSPSMGDSNTKDGPALHDAWMEIESARRQLQKERELHTARLRSEWSVLQEQIEQLRELSIGSSFSPVNQPNDASPSAQIDIGFAPAPSPLDGVGGQDEGKQPDQSATVEQGRANNRQPSAGTSYTAGLLSELEEYADSLMKRNEAVHFMNDSVKGSGEVGGRGSSNDPRQMAQAARLARRKARAQTPNSDGLESDSDSGDDDFDRDAYIEQVLGGIQEAPKGTKAPKVSDSKDLIPLALESEMEEVNAQMKAVLAEAEAVEKAKRDAQELDEGGFYALLEVSPDATSIQLKKAYHKAMMKWHPDKYQGQEKEEATLKTSQLGQAYHILSDKFERSLYDIMGVEQYLIHANVIQCFINYLVTGCKVKKHPRKTYTSWKFIDRRFVRNRLFWLSTDHKHLNVARKRNLEPTEAEMAQIKQVEIAKIFDIKKGLTTDVLTQTGVLKREKRYFSLCTEERTLDLEAPDNKQRDFLYSRLTLLVIQLQQNLEWFKRFYEEGYRKKRGKKRGKNRKRKPKPPTEDPPPPPREERQYDSDEY